MMEAIKAMRDRDVAYVDVKPDVQARYNSRIQEQLEGSVWSSGCGSWYLDEQGRNGTLWPGLTTAADSSVEVAYAGART
jgi:hypothetical protein